MMGVYGESVTDRYKLPGARQHALKVVKSGAIRIAGLLWT